MENTTNNTTTASNPPFLWVAPSKQRDTIGILYFCFTTMIICVWSTVHFNIPTTRHGPIRHFLLRVLWMLIALIAPELLFFFATNERISASALVKGAMEYLPSQQLSKPGKFARAFNHILGRTKAEDQERYHLVDRISRPRKYRFGLVHAFYATMGGFVLDTSPDDETVAAEEPPSESSTNNQNTRHVPKISALIYIMKHFPHIIPDISEESITDRSESSSLSKALLIVQIGWFCTNCASRIIQRLPLSLLEVSTAAHAVCTLLTFFVWKSKPLNVADGTLMRGKEAREVHALITCSSSEYSMALEMAKRVAAGDSPTAANSDKNDKLILAANALRHLPDPEAPEFSPFRKRFSFSAPGAMGIHSPSFEEYDWMIAGISPIIYGLVHFLAWSDQFPTPLEHLLWRVSSVVVTCSGLAVTLPLLIYRYMDRFEDDHPQIFMIIALIVACIIVPAPFAHIVASAFLLVESFRQLFFLDAAAYQVPSWSNYWPHLA